MGVTVKLEGVDKLRKKLEAKSVEYQREIEEAVGETADDISQDWRRSVPVDDGDYRDSIGVEHEGQTATVANFGRKGWHGRFVEFGTSNRSYPKQPAAGPAAERGRNTFTEALKRALR